MIRDQDKVYQIGTLQEVARVQKGPVQARDPIPFWHVMADVAKSRIVRKWPGPGLRANPARPNGGHRAENRLSALRHAAGRDVQTPMPFARG